MNIEIHALSRDREADFLRFFDEEAFADHGEWSWCYCTFFHAPYGGDAAHPIECKEDGRCFAQSLIEDGTMRGYLAYANGKVVGWCNAGEKESYRLLKDDASIWAGEDQERILSVVCFAIAPDARRQGVARQLLQHACEDAAKRGFKAVEAYPSHGEHGCFEHYHGYPTMYTELGFERRNALDSYEGSVVRKTL